MQVERITDGTREVLTAAAVEMALLKHDTIHLVHVLLAFSLRRTAVSGVIRRQGLDTQRLREIISGIYPKVDIAGPIERYADEVVTALNEASTWLSDDAYKVRPDQLFIKLLESEDAALGRVLDEIGADRRLMLFEAERVRQDLDGQCGRNHS